MDNRAVVKSLILLSVAALAATGCSNNSDQIPTHSESEQKAMDAEKKLTPQQHIDQIQKGQLPEGAKNAMIQKIKDQNGMK